ncbi:MAG TPA: signal peptidase I [Methanobacterium sp.]|nr:signal peptidase I [Methanobacterium sp.]
MNYKEIATYIVIILIGIVVAQHMDVVVSGSMEPVMYRGDLVIIDNNPSTVQVGDISVYRGTWPHGVPEDIIHRIIGIGQLSNGTTAMEFKGDNNPSPDPEVVYPDQIIAKVVTINGQPLIIPKIGYISIWFKELMGQNI